MTVCEGNTGQATYRPVPQTSGAGIPYRGTVDVFLLLRRPDGRVLLLERTGNTYASGLLCSVSGHLEDGESVLDGAVREADEEVGVRIDPADARFVHLIHYRSPEGEGRIGVAFTARRWDGKRHNREPHKHARLVRADPADPSARCAPYTAALLSAIAAGALCSLHGWPDLPGQMPVRYAGGER